MNYLPEKKICLACKGLSKTDTHTSIWVIDPFCHWHHTALRFCPCHLRQNLLLSLVPHTSNHRECASISTNRAAVIFPLSASTSFVEEFESISAAPCELPSPRFTQAFAVNQCQMWECRSAAPMSRRCESNSWTKARFTKVEWNFFLLVDKKKYLSLILITSKT